MTDAQRVAARRLERAQEALAAARMLADAGFWGACVNRLYYACFYAAGALLALRGLSAKTHSGVRTLLGQHFVDPQLLRKEHMAFYNRLFNARQRADYEDFVELDASARPWIGQAEAFVAACAVLVSAERA